MVETIYKHPIITIIFMGVLTACICNVISTFKGET